jgi:cyclophilin family peptidyl-prolyl cis-trans isomerase
MTGKVEIRPRLQRQPSRTGRKSRALTRRKPMLEAVENRQLLTASLQAIAPLDVPALQGYTLPLLANTGATNPQTFTVSSSNPDIGVSIAQGPFWTLDVATHNSSNGLDSFSGALTFQLFQNLTPNTVKMITQFTNDGYYVSSGMYFPRIVSNFDSPGVTVIQGGSATPDGNGMSGQPNTPFANEDLQQLALTGSDQLALANSGGTNTNDTQFFINTGPANDLGYNYTVFGQMVSGQATLAKMAQLPVKANPLTGEISEPVNPLVITGASMSTTNPDGVAIIDTTQAKPGETATITVTAHDALDGTTATRSFLVTVAPYDGPTSQGQIANVDFKPYASPVSAAAYMNTPVNVQLTSQNTYPDPSVPVPNSYAPISMPKDGTISNFNAATGSFTYTPNPGFAGTDSFQYVVTATGPNTSAPPANSNPATVTIAVSNSLPPVVTIQNVTLSQPRRNELTAIRLTFSGPINGTQADSPATYRLNTAGRGGSFTARNARAIRTSSIDYNSSDNTVTLTLARPLRLTRPLELVVEGTGSAGLVDASGRYIDGAKTGQPGTSAVITISRKGVKFAGMG